MTRQLKTVESSSVVRVDWFSGRLIFRTRTFHSWTGKGWSAKNMGIRIPGILLSKNGLLVASQLVVNVLLAGWIYNEYLHNRYMQDYLASAWPAIWPVLALVAGFGVGAGAIFTLYSRGRLPLLVSPKAASLVQAISTTSLETIDACPFCETPLKTISTGRLQCRNCRRYFKSSLPKVEAA